MAFYHGSPIGGLTHLKPFLSNHQKPYIYFASNPLVALLYAVKPLPKPFSYYPYGFDKYGNVVYSEHWENAFFDIYKGKTGYLYECDELENYENPTGINCAYTSEIPVKVDRVTEITDIYDYYMKQKEKGLFYIKTLQEVSEKEMKFGEGYLNEMIELYDLRNNPKHPMSMFIREHFTKVWERE